MKICNSCHQNKPYSEFWNYKRSPDGKMYRCIPCEKKYIKQFRPSQRASQRRLALQNKYNLTLDDYEELLAKQDSRCAVCRNHETEITPSGDSLSLAVDHNHHTGQVRGLLCGRCNKAIGLANDSREVLLAMVEYLKIAEIIAQDLQEGR